LCYYRGEWQKAFETAQKGSELAKKTGEVTRIAWNEWILARYYEGMGEVRKAISIFDDVLALDKRAKNTTHIAYPLHGLGACYLWLGEWDKSLQYLMEALDIAEKARGLYIIVSELATQSLGELFMEMEDYVEAEKYLNQCNNISEKAGRIDNQYSEVFPALSKLYLKKGAIEKAKELIEKAYEYATKTKNPSTISYAEMSKAMLFREQKKWEESIQNFEKSLQGYKALNAQKWYVDQFAELLYEYGLMHLDRNEEGDKERAYSLLNQALEIYRKMDAKKKTEKIIAKKKLLTA